jgi:hypothetical protein
MFEMVFFDGKRANAEDSSEWVQFYKIDTQEATRQVLRRYRKQLLSVQTRAEEETTFSEEII